MYLWRAVDHEGEILDMLVQRRRDKRAALRLMRKPLRKQRFAPRLVVTDKLRSYGAAFHDLHLTCRHEQGLKASLHRSLTPIMLNLRTKFRTAPSSAPLKLLCQ
jgi:putative transposase